MTAMKIRVRQVKPGVWVPCETGETAVTWESAVIPHLDPQCRCEQCLVIAAGACIARHARTEVIMATARWAAATMSADLKRAAPPAGQGSGAAITIRESGSWQVPAPLISPLPLFLYGEVQPATLDGQPLGPCPALPAPEPAGNLALPVTQEPIVAEEKDSSKAPAKAKARAKREPGPRLTPAERLALSLTEPTGMDQEDLDEIAPYGVARPGFCTGCLIARATRKDGRCWYCGKAHDLARAAETRAAGEYREGRIWTCGCGCAAKAVHEPRLAGASGKQFQLALAVVLSVAGSLLSLWIAITVFAPMLLPAFGFLVLALGAASAWTSGHRKGRK